MGCAENETLIHGYLDGELDLAHSLEVEAHLGACEKCQQAYRDYKNLRATISEKLLYQKPNSNLAARIQIALHEAGQRGTPRPIRESSRELTFWRVPWVLAGVAIAAFAIAAILILWRVRPFGGGSGQELLAQEVLSSHVRSLMANHLTDVPSSDQHTVKPWFDGKLDFAPVVEDLSSQGFPLVGGRLDYLMERPVAALVYQRRKHFINLFIWPSAQEARDSGAVTAMRQGYNLLYWNQSHMTFWAVSDLNNNELQQFAQLLQNRGKAPN